MQPTNKSKIISIVREHDKVCILENLINKDTKLEKIISVLPESKLKEIIDFASYLRDKEEAEELLRMQISSKDYSDWLNPKNDIYDEVFKDLVWIVMIAVNPSTRKLIF